MTAERDALLVSSDQFAQAAIHKGAEITRLREVLAGREDTITEMRRALDNLQAENDRLARVTRLNQPEPVRPAPAPVRPLSRRERLQGV